jgi:hypothetical protein
MNLKDVFAQLSEPFPADAVHWRVGATNGDKTKGIALAYIDARDVFDRLDAVVGPENWETRIEETAKGRVLCSLTILGVTKTDGAGDTDMEGEKGGISDAIKRTAVQFGVGRYLYRLPNAWCKITQAGKSYRLAETPTLPDWALPKGAKPKAPPKPKGDGKFMASVNDLVFRGITALVSIDPKADHHQTMEERMSRILGNQGFESCEEITERKAQIEFYNALKETVEAIESQVAA